MDCTVYAAKTKELISCTFSPDTIHFILFLSLCCLLSFCLSVSLSNEMNFELNKMLFMARFFITCTPVMANK